MRKEAGFRSLDNTLVVGYLCSNAHLMASTAIEPPLWTLGNPPTAEPSPTTPWLPVSQFIPSQYCIRAIDCYAAAQAGDIGHYTLLMEIGLVGYDSLQITDDKGSNAKIHACMTRSKPSAVSSV